MLPLILARIGVSGRRLVFYRDQLFGVEDEQAGRFRVQLVKWDDRRHCLEPSGSWRWLTRKTLYDKAFVIQNIEWHPRHWVINQPKRKR